MSILIAGAGLGGLTLGAMLHAILGVLENPSFDVLTSLRGTIQIRL